MFIEDLDAFFTDFGMPATVGGQAVQVIFDNASQGTSVGVLGMAGTQPAITIKTADLAADPVGAVAVVNGTSYTITQHEPDGTGMSVCLLEIA